MLLQSDRLTLFLSADMFICETQISNAGALKIASLANPADNGMVL